MRVFTITNHNFKCRPWAACFAVSASVYLVLQCIFGQNANAADRSAKNWAVMMFAGPLVEQELSGIVFPANGIDVTDTRFGGVSVSKRVYEFDHPLLTGFSLEAEVGAGYQSGGSNNDAAQVWGAVYMRYDAFPWNNFIKTTFAGSVGLNYITKKTEFENNETRNGNTKKLLHYFSPEITFAAPSRPDDEFVMRLHHRSGASGLFGCEGCGSNFITFGYRKRF